MFNLTNAIAITALDCRFTLLPYIVTIIIDSSMGIVIIVGWGFMGRVVFVKGLLFLWCDEGTGWHLYEVFVEHGGLSQEFN